MGAANRRFWFDTATSETAGSIADVTYTKQYHPSSAAQTAVTSVSTIGFEVQAEPLAGLFVSGRYHHYVGANTFPNRSGPVGGRGLSWFEVILPDTAALDALRDRFDISRIPVTDGDDGIVVPDPDEIEIRFRVET